MGGGPEPSKSAWCCPSPAPPRITENTRSTGAKIALDRVNKAGGVLGKQIELVTEDDQTTNPGAVLAFSKLAAQPDIVAFLGSDPLDAKPRDCGGHP